MFLDLASEPFLPTQSGPLKVVGWVLVASKIRAAQVQILDPHFEFLFEGLKLVTFACFI